MDRYLGPNSRKITLLIIFTTIGSVISGANDQGKFWNLYNILFKNQDAENSG
jgi:TM2 domain-containing membrane protein YozV